MTRSPSSRPAVVVGRQRRPRWRYCSPIVTQSSSEQATAPSKSLSSGDGAVSALRKACGIAAMLVIGQADFTHHACAASATRLCAPRGVTPDRRGNLYVVDADNNRVLIFKAPLTTGMAACRVIGQPTLHDTTCNRGGAPGVQTLCGPKGLALYGQGNLYVAQDDNNRVVGCPAPLDRTIPTLSATLVFGQPNFSAHACGVGRARLCGPSRVTVGQGGQLLVGDSGNNRVLVFAGPLHNTLPTRVIGQPTFTVHAVGTTAYGFAGPQSVTVDAREHLYATDEDNN